MRRSKNSACADLTGVPRRETHLSLARRLTFVTGGISSILPRVQLGVYTQSSGSLMGTRHWLGSALRGAYMEQPVNTWLVSGLYTKEKSWTGGRRKKKKTGEF